MAIQAADVTYTVNRRKGAGGGRYKTQATVGWPSGLTYDRGGIPITKGALGLRAKIEVFVAMDPVTVTGDVWMYDVSGERLKGFGVTSVDANGAPVGLVEISSGDTLLSHTIDVWAEGHN